MHCKHLKKFIKVIVNVGILIIIMLTMNMINRETVTRCNVKAPTDSIYFHISIDLTALCKCMFNFFHGLVILALFNVSWIWRSPPFEFVSFPYFLTSIAASVNKELYLTTMFHRLNFYYINKTLSLLLNHICGCSVTVSTNFCGRTDLDRL